MPDNWFQQTLDPFTGTQGEVEVEPTKHHGVTTVKCRQCGQQVISCYTDQGDAYNPKTIKLSPELRPGGTWFLSGEKGKIARRAAELASDNDFPLYYEHNCPGFKEKT